MWSSRSHQKPQHQFKGKRTSILKTSLLKKLLEQLFAKDCCRKLLETARHQAVLSTFKRLTTLLWLDASVIVALSAFLEGEIWARVAKSMDKCTNEYCMNEFRSVAYSGKRHILPQQLIQVFRIHWCPRSTYSDNKCTPLFALGEYKSSSSRLFIRLVYLLAGRFPTHPESARYFLIVVPRM